MFGQILIGLLLAMALIAPGARAQGTGPITPNGKGVQQLGSTGAWFKGVYLGANSTAYGVLNGTFTAARTFTLPDASGTVALASGGGAFSATTLTATATNSLNLGTAGSAVGQATFANATTGGITLQAPTGALGTAVVTLPDNTGAIPVATTCGASLAAAGACANTSLGGNGHILVGSAVLSSNTSTITGISPAFTSSTSWWCVANDVTTRANVVQAIPGSGTTLVITNTTGATDLIQYICAGN